MAVAATPPQVQLRVVTPTTALDPSCCPERCDYRPARIGYILRMLDELAQSGYEPSEALMSTLDPPDSPYERRPTSFGPSEPTGAKIVADIWRAMRAGHRSPTAIAVYLCPMSLTDIEDS